MISTLSTCENGNFTVNTQYNALVLFSSCMCNHDSCIGSSVNKLIKNINVKIIPRNPLYSAMHFIFFFLKWLQIPGRINIPHISVHQLVSLSMRILIPPSSFSQLIDPTSMSS